MTTPTHVPVMLGRVIDLLAPAVEATGTNAIIIDATLGLGGHTEAILRRFPQARVIGIDRDPEALALARKRLGPLADRVTLIHAVYDQIARALDEAGATAVDGVLFDLGVSSMQLDVADRGFAYAQEAPLDMRMDPTVGVTAAEVLNTYGTRELARVLRLYGEERFAHRIADAIVAERASAPMATSSQLVDVVRRSIPAAARRTGGNPAKRTFQALRMEVNDELGAYQRALPAAMDALRGGGRIVVLAYHSLEDRYTKRTFAAATSSDVPRDLPMVPASHAPRFASLTRGAEQASGPEVAQNPRAASARLRAIEKLEAA